MTAPGGADDDAPCDVDDDHGGPWDDSSSARRPRWRELLAGAGLALAAGVLIAVVVVGGLVALVVASFRPSHRSGPGDGRHSRHLPVAVSPATDLRNGELVQVRASRLAGAGEAVIAQCTAEADRRSAGVAQCDLAHRDRVRVHKGRAAGSFYLARSLTLPDGRTVDCGDRPARCVLMVASAENYDRSGFARLTFLAGAP